MKWQQYLVLVLLVSVGSCTTAKKKTQPVVSSKPKIPSYSSANELIKSAQCSKKVEGSPQGDQVLIFKPTYMLFNDPADVFCVQKLQKGHKFLRISSLLESMNNETNPVPDKKFLATAFDLVVYDKKLEKISLSKPVYRSPSTGEILSFYDFSKAKKFPVYVAILFKQENRDQAYYTQEMLQSDAALIDHSANTAAAGFMMGGFAAGSAVSMSQPKGPLKYSVYARTPIEVKADWVHEIPKK